MLPPAPQRGAVAYKTSQLQIRVTEAQKAALRRLAAAANTTVSEYVLSQALPSAQGELDRVVGALAGTPEQHQRGLERLAELIVETPAGEFHEFLASAPLQALPPIVRNQVAALVERAAHDKGAAAPDWVQEVAPLPRPHFLWPLTSLRPHQIRVAPVAFKRRNLFFDPASQPALRRLAGLAPPTGEEGREGLRRLKKLDDALQSLELKVEFYFLGGAVLSQAFTARPQTAHIDAMFQPASKVLAAATELGAGEGWPPGWVQSAAKESLLAGARPDRFLELPHLAAFAPPPEYVLAIKVAALRLGAGERAADDLRYVLRALNLTTADEALSVTGRYFGVRQIPARAREILEGLLAP